VAGYRKRNEDWKKKEKEVSKAIRLVDEMRLRIGAFGLGRAFPLPLSTLASFGVHCTALRINGIT
jgi:hypothetical protein